MHVHAARVATVARCSRCGRRSPAFAQSPAEFFKDKTVTFYVGLSAGGGYDVNARLVARISASTSPAIRRSSCATCRAAAAW